MEELHVLLKQEPRLINRGKTDHCLRVSKSMSDIVLRLMRQDKLHITAHERVKAQQEQHSTEIDEQKNDRLQQMSEQEHDRCNVEDPELRYMYKAASRWD